MRWGEIQLGSELRRARQGPPARHKPMTDSEALEIIRAQGHAAGVPDSHTGRVRIWMHGVDEPVDVTAGHELHDLASGKISLEEIRERRQYEEVEERA